MNSEGPEISGPAKTFVAFLTVTRFSASLLPVRGLRASASRLTKIFRAVSRQGAQMGSTL